MPIQNKYIPLSFSLNYFSSNFERSYSALYIRPYAAGIRPEYDKNIKNSDIFNRTRILKAHYPERIKDLDGFGKKILNRNKEDYLKKQK